MCMATFHKFLTIGPSTSMGRWYIRIIKAGLVLDPLGIRGSEPVIMGKFVALVALKESARTKRL